MLSFLATNKGLAEIADEVARALSSSLATPAGCFIRTSLVYPSGTTVVTRIDGSGDQFFVSDVGFGYQEAMMMNASHSYPFIARSLVRESEISFDSRSFFVAEAAHDELVGAVGAIANYSQRAVIETTLKHEARRADNDRTALLDRLTFAFGRFHVEKDVEVHGASSVEWEVTARVVQSNVVALFDYARPHKNSVSSTVAKFHDIARLPTPPRRIVTVRDYAGMGKFIGFLSQAAAVIELENTPDEVLRRLAA